MDPISPDKLLLRPSTVAEMLDQSRSQVYKLIHDGTLPSVRIGHSIRVPARALRDLLDKLDVHE